MQSYNLCDEVGLGSLSREHIAAYLDGTFSPNDFPPELASMIYEKTEGHPLFATNLLQYLSERGDIGKTVKNGTESGPGTAPVRLQDARATWSLTRPLAHLDLDAPETVRCGVATKISA